MHLGDYIYEYEAGGERASAPPTEIFSLYDYRTRHGQVGIRSQLISRKVFVLSVPHFQYRSDPDLQLLHQNFPWITTWDDHGRWNEKKTDARS